MPRIAGGVTELIGHAPLLPQQFEDPADNRRGDAAVQPDTVERYLSTALFQER